MTCRTLWNTTRDESFHSYVLSEIDFMYSTKELENKDAECFFYNGKFSEDEQGEMWIKCFSWTLPEQRTQSIPMTFIDSKQIFLRFKPPIPYYPAISY